MLEGGFVTYNKPSKNRTLRLPEQELCDKGSVTPLVAAKMAEGALQCSQADIAVAATGVLGPEPDEDGNPAGLVFAACMRRGRPPVRSPASISQRKVGYAAARPDGAQMPSIVEQHRMSPNLASGQPHRLFACVTLQLMNRRRTLGDQLLECGLNPCPNTDDSLAAR